MPNEMIERVARAIRDSFNSNDIDCYPIAKAAIEAMREPTEEMCNAAYVQVLIEDSPSSIFMAMIDAALKE